MILNSWKRNWEYFKELYIIKFKCLLEYPINFYFAILNNLGSLFVQCMILFAISLNFKELINWGLKEYLFFILIQNLFMRLFGGILWFGTHLKIYLIKGKLNILILKPVNLILQYFGDTTPFQAIIVSIFYLIGLIYYIIYYHNEINIIKIVPTLILGIFGALMFGLIIRFLEGFSFFIKNNNFMIKTYQDTSRLFNQYPANMFKGNIQYFSYICGNVFYGLFTTLYFFGEISNITFFRMIISLLFVNIILLIMLNIIWKIGLKKYEAFG